jgi:hypothetical protein
MMFAYIFGVLLFGWYGVFLGPFLLVVTVNLGRVALVDLVQGEPVTYERAAQPLASGRSDAGVETDGDVGATGGPGDVDGTDGS